MTRYPDLYVLRHGETEWNREGIFQGVRFTAYGHGARTGGASG